MEPTPHNDEMNCSECGAPAVDGLTCWEQLGMLISWEFQDPELQAEHFLTVASYNLQHPAQFTHDALTGLRAMFIEHLDTGLSVVEIRRRFAYAFEGNTKVLKDKADQRPVLRTWDMTIADVYTPDQSTGAAARVRAWAAAIRKDLSGLDNTPRQPEC